MEWKSTFFGLALIVFSSILIYKNITHDYWINGVLYLMGILFFFTGDDWVEGIEKLLFRFLNNKVNDNKND